MPIFPDDYVEITPVGDDEMLVADSLDSNTVKKSQLKKVIKAGLQSGFATADDISDGVTKKIMTATERTKLSSVAFGAQPNAVLSVNGQQGNVLLDMDDIPDTATRRAVTPADDAEFADFQAHITDNNNPHNVTKAQVGLSNVDNLQQLSQTPGSFSGLEEKTDEQAHLEDLFVVQDSDDDDKIKKVKNQTLLIWMAGFLQDWMPSVNYKAYDFMASTQIKICSVVIYQGTLWKCLVSHQSINFPAELALGYWQSIGGLSGNILSSGNGVPTADGINAGDLYVDLATGNLYYWDGDSWEFITNGGGGGGNVISDSIPSVDRSVPVYNGISGTHIVESPVTIDGSGNVDGINDIDVDGTATFNGDANFNQSNITYNQTTENYIGNEMLIACQVGPLTFATPYTAQPATQLTKVQVTFDNGVDGADTKITNTLLNGVTQILNFVSGTDTGSVQISWTAGDITVTILTGTVGFFTLDGICDYNGYAVNNYTDKIEVYDNVTQELTDVVINNDNVVVNGDIINNANNTYTGDNTFEGDTIFNNITITGTTIGANQAFTDKFISTASQTIFTLSDTPINENFVWVSLNNGQYAKKIDDFSLVGNTITLATPATLGDKIDVQYIKSLGSVVVTEGNINSTTFLFPSSYRPHTYSTLGGAANTAVITDDYNYNLDNVGVLSYISGANRYVGVTLQNPTYGGNSGIIGGYLYAFDGALSASYRTLVNVDVSNAGNWTLLNFSGYVPTGTMTFRGVDINGLRYFHDTGATVTSFIRYSLVGTTFTYDSTLVGPGANTGTLFVNSLGIVDSGSLYDLTSTLVIRTGYNNVIGVFNDAVYHDNGTGRDLIRIF